VDTPVTRKAAATRPADEASLSRFLAEERLPSAFGEWIDDLYRPLADAILARRREGSGAMVVGLCGPQGSGKSTGARVLAHLLDGMGARSAVLSLDDLYLTREERAGLARSVHPLLLTRGPPGTHDTRLGERLLRDLARLPSIRMPRFDKAIDDRAPVAGWPNAPGPADIILFEGWCVGARPQPGEALETPVNALEATRDAAGVWRRVVDERLAGSYQDLFRSIGLQIVFRPPGFDVVATWRLEQEHKLRAHAVANGDPTASLLTDAQVRGFIQYYERLARHIDAEMPARADIVITLDDERRPTDVAMR
jgi:D-glycerate 3-kinase